MEYNSTMKKPLSIFAAIIIAASASADGIQMNHRTKSDAYLSALGQIESGGNDFAKGRKGEIGRYQCLKRVWREATAAPYSSATNTALAERVTLCVIWNRTGKDINQITPKEFARAWHCPNAHHLNQEQKDYIKRFQNICKNSH